MSVCYILSNKIKTCLPIKHVSIWQIVTHCSLMEMSTPYLQVKQPVNLKSPFVHTYIYIIGIYIISIWPILYQHSCLVICTKWKLQITKNLPQRHEKNEGTTKCQCLQTFIHYSVFITIFFFPNILYPIWFFTPFVAYVTCFILLKIYLFFIFTCTSYRSLRIWAFGKAKHQQVSLPHKVATNTNIPHLH